MGVCSCEQQLIQPQLPPIPSSLRNCYITDFQECTMWMMNLSKQPCNVIWKILLTNIARSFWHAAVNCTRQMRAQRWLACEWRRDEPAAHYSMRSDRVVRCDYDDGGRGNFVSAMSDDPVSPSHSCSSPEMEFCTKRNWDIHFHRSDNKMTMSFAALP